MKNLIDTHCHLYDKAFDEDRLLASQRAQKNGLINILMPNVDLASLPRMLELHKSDPTFFRPMLGLHPCSVAKNYKEELSLLKSSIEDATFIEIKQGPYLQSKDKIKFLNVSEKKIKIKN